MEHEKDRQNLVTRALVLIGFLLILVIMLSFIAGIVNERSGLYDETVTELGATWGKEQTVAGPVLVVPYFIKTIREEYDKNGKRYGREANVEKKAVFLPSSLNAKVKISDEIRNRGIYKATVYTADLQMSGNFKINAEAYFANISDDIVSISYDKAYVSFGITDTGALTQIKSFLVGGVEFKSDLSSGSGLRNIPEFEKGVSAMAIFQDPKAINIPYDISMVFRGSNKITMLPLGEENTVDMESSWPSPSFYGFASSEKNITDGGFDAKWIVSKLNRSHPQAFNYDQGYDLNEASFGVRFYDGITHYRQVIRAVKYGYLFFALSFLVLFIFDMTNKNGRVHFLQYGVVGVSLVMFYLLLLSLSEHMGFIPAYLISTGAVVVPISLYIIGFMQDKKYGIGMFAILTGLYMILLSILKMENFALLVGTVLVMITIYVLMYLTRHLKGESGMLSNFGISQKEKEGDKK